MNRNPEQEWVVIGGALIQAVLIGVSVVVAIIFIVGAFMIFY